jgi:hypothetical protein
MSNMTLIVIIICLSALIPDMVVLLVSFLRILALERRLEAVDALKQTIEIMEKRTLETREETIGVKAKVYGLDESFISLSNKWNARFRVENAALRRAKKEDEEEGPAVEQQELIPLPANLRGAAAPVNGPRKRQFGEFPT